MKDFRLFDISDFVMDEDFIRWVHKKSGADNEFWENWLNQNPDKYMAVAEARRILESIGSEQPSFSGEEKQKEIDRLMSTIRTQSYEPLEQPRISWFRKWQVAASILLVIVASALTYYLMNNNNRTPQKFDYAAITATEQLIENINTSEKPITLKLPDESTIELAPKSRLAYANNFDSSSTRDVYLSGEAFFKVTKNSSRPFRVFSNEIMTTVLGTSFSVRSFDKDTIIQVRVRTGKVSVYSASDLKKGNLPNAMGGIILTPNQELVYEKSKQKFQKALLQDPSAIVADPSYEKSMSYEDVSLEKVFEQLSRVYGINIVYDNELLKKCTVTADLRNESFYRKIELICKAISASYEIIDGQVVIQASGCE